MYHNLVETEWIHQAPGFLSAHLERFPRSSVLQHPARETTPVFRSMGFHCPAAVLQAGVLYVIPHSQLWNFGSFFSN